MYSTMTLAEPHLSSSRIERIKATLLTEGITLTPEAQCALEKGGWKVPRLVRSGMSGGLEFTLKYDGCDIAMSCKYSINATPLCGLVIHFENSFYLTESEDVYVGEVKFVPEPSYYSKHTSSGKCMASIGQRCFVRLAIGVFGNCALNADPKTACGFCAIHKVRETDSCFKSDSDILETVATVRDSELTSSIETIMLGGGTPSSPDRGATRFASLAAQIGKIVPWRITSMLVPPASDDDLKRMHDSGIKEVSINLEFGSDSAFKKYIPGKASLIGRKRYLECIESAVQIFGENNVQSLLVIGLEDSKETLQAVDWLAERRVIPVLSPFRPLHGTKLADRKAPTASDVVEVYNQAKQIVNKHGGCLGPRCIPCQCNTMTLPWDVR